MGCVRLLQPRCYTVRLMRSTQFCRIVRGVALVILAWTAFDIGFPGLCALDSEWAQIAYASAPVTVASSTGERDAPAPPVHIDDCFCCSHCVDVAGVPAPEGLDLTVDVARLPSDSLPFSLQYPPYHPPRS